MSNLEFGSLEELYSRIKPALYSKVQELKRKSCFYIKEVDIWNYLSTTTWKNGRSLALCDMVNDIFCLEDQAIKNYVLNILNKQEREIVKEEETLL